MIRVFRSLTMSYLCDGEEAEQSRGMFFAKMNLVDIEEYVLREFANKGFVCIGKLGAHNRPKIYSFKYTR